MTKGIFVTATGTDTGKTYISGLLVKKMRDSGLNCGYYKPVLSGLEEKNGKLIPGDVDYVLKISGIDTNPFELVSFFYKQPLSPHLAAQFENNPVALEKVKSDFERIKHKYNTIVVEGAGGITCPLRLDNDCQILLSDIIKLLNLDIIIVATAELGTINATFLTVEYARQLGIQPKGIILNNFDENNIMHIDNKSTIENLTGVKVVATVKNNEKDLKIEKDTLYSLFKEI